MHSVCVVLLEHDPVLIMCCCWITARKSLCAINVLPYHHAVSPLWPVPSCLWFTWKTADMFHEHRQPISSLNFQKYCTSSTVSVCSCNSQDAVIALKAPLNTNHPTSRYIDGWPSWLSKNDSAQLAAFSCIPVSSVFTDVYMSCIIDALSYRKVCICLMNYSTCVSLVLWHYTLVLLC